LTRGIINPAAGEACRNIINDLAAQGAQAIILGCTELPLLIKQESSAIPLFDITAIHARAAVDYALGIQSKEQ
jgi:aspartate racemase